MNQHNETIWKSTPEQQNLLKKITPLAQNLPKKRNKIKEETKSLPPPRGSDGGEEEETDLGVEIESSWSFLRLDVKSLAVDFFFSIKNKMKNTAK